MMNRAERDRWTKWLREWDKNASDQRRPSPIATAPYHNWARRTGLDGRVQGKECTTVESVILAVRRLARSRRKSERERGDHELRGAGISQGKPPPAAELRCEVRHKLELQCHVVGTDAYQLRRVESEEVSNLLKQRFVERFFR